MQIKLKQKVYTVMVGDCETHADKQTVDAALKGDFSRVGTWLWCGIDSYHDADFLTANIWATTPEEYVQLLHEKSREKGNLIIYFFNLGFDFGYLVKALKADLNEAYQESKDKKDHLPYFGKSNYSTVYKATAIYPEYEWIFVDLKNLLGPGSLRYQCGAFGVKHFKESLDSYTKDRHDPNWKLTNDEMEYCYYDCASCFEILEWFDNNQDIREEFFSSVTAAGFSTKVCLKKCYGTIVRKKDTTNRNGTHVTKKAGTAMDPKLLYRKDYPELSDEIDEKVRESYKGGLCYPTFNGGLNTTGGLIAHIDAASMYPSRVCCENRYPYGKPMVITGEKIYSKTSQIALFKIKFCYNDRPIMNPCVNLNKVLTKWMFPIHIDLDYPLTGEAFDTITIWDFELEWYKKCFPGFKYEVLETILFNCSPCKLKPFFEFYFREKQNAGKTGNKAYKAFCKLMINSVTGKFGERIHDIGYVIQDDGTLVQTDIPAKAGKYTYVPLISAITAYGRCELLRRAYEVGFEKVLYCDTDSIFFTTTKTELTKILGREWIGSDLGQWELEDVYTGLQIACAKKYQGWCAKQPKGTDDKTWFCNDDNLHWEWSNTISGVSDGYKDDYMDIINGVREFNTAHSRSTPNGKLIFEEKMQMQRTEIIYSKLGVNKGERYLSAEFIKQHKAEDFKDAKERYGSDPEYLKLVEKDIRKKYSEYERCCL